MFTTIISDCSGENEAGRQVARFNSLGLGPADLIGVSSDFSADATIEASANLLDTLDATEGRNGIIAVNVAPRGEKKDGNNGTSFCYFYYKETLIISTIKGFCLSFIKRFGIENQVNCFNIPEVLDWAKSINLLDGVKANYINNTQFRSFDFVPRVAKWIADGQTVPSNPMSLNHLEIPDNCIWHLDIFGNAKTTLTNNDIKPNKPEIPTNLGVFPFYEKLKDVPHGSTAIYVGSSGFGNNRFLEIATQGISGSAKVRLNLKIGDKIELM